MVVAELLLEIEHVRIHTTQSRTGALGFGKVAVEVHHHGHDLRSISALQSNEGAGMCEVLPIGIIHHLSNKKELICIMLVHH